MSCGARWAVERARQLSVTLLVYDAIYGVFPMNPSPNPPETHASAAPREAGALESYRRQIAENNALIQSSTLDFGREIVVARTAVHNTIAGDWAERQQAALGYTRPFALVALGGTGREEVTPCSDLDYAFLVDDEVEGNKFLLELQRQALHTTEFEEAHGFAIAPLPFDLDDLKKVTGKDLISFLDLRPVYDPHDLATAFRARIRATYDPFEHFLQAREFWREQLAHAPACERLDRFDIKNDALRIFQGGIWTLAGKDYVHSHQIYQQLADRRDLEAYYFLLRIRAWVHLRRPCGGKPTAAGNHPEDVLTFDDFASFGEMLEPGADEAARFDFAIEVRARLLSARRRIASFARGVIERELRRGRRVSINGSIVYGAGGLYHSAPHKDQARRTRSRAAFSLLLTAQHYGLPIDPSELQATFHNAGDWLERVPEVAALFHEARGSLADTFAFLSQIDGAEERLFPGRSRFEVSFDERVLTERRELRGALELRKLRTLEDFIARTPRSDAPNAWWAQTDASPADAAALLDTDHLAAVKLALKTKRLPMTPEDEAQGVNAARPSHQRPASGFSGIPLAEYYQRFGPECGFNKETLAVTEFLVANRRTFKLRADEGQNDRRQVESFRALCGTEQRLHALFVFTCADRIEWENEPSYPARWFSIRELYHKTRAAFHNEDVDAATALSSAGYAPEDLRILSDFGEDFFSGLYRRHANRFGTDLVRLAQAPEANPPPKAALLHYGASVILGVAARDFRGLAACISGALWKERVGLRQAHFFSAMNQRLVLDFFHLATSGGAVPAGLPRVVEQAVRDQLHISSSDEGAFPKLGATVDLQATRPGQYRLRCQSEGDTGGLIYALCLKLLLHFRADIHTLSASNTRAGTFITIHHSLPQSLSLEDARRIVRESF